MNTNGKKNAWPEPLIIEPSGSRHTHTFIVLHGRGSNADRFGRELLASGNLQARLPTVKFVFPTASKRRSTILRKMQINQWFDNYSLEDPNQRTDLQVDGLRETAQYLRDLVDVEARILDGIDESEYQKVIIGGLSQGCAAAVFTLLGGGFGPNGNERPGAFFGMSGWLPFESQLLELLDDGDTESHENSLSEEDDEADLETDLQRSGSSHSSTSEEDESEQSSSEEEEEDDDGYELSGSDAEINNESDDELNPDISTGDNSKPQSEETAKFASGVIDVLNHIRELLELSPIPTDMNETGNVKNQNDYTVKERLKSAISILQTPGFLGHGCDNQKVSVQLGEKMQFILSKILRMDVTWKAYKGLGHSYKVPDEIDDLLDFLKLKINLPVCDGTASQDAEEN